MHTKQPGFTIVELLIVIVVIGILASITVVSYSNAQSRARNVATQSEVRKAAAYLEAHVAIHGSYPSTGGLSTSRSDVNCAWGTKTTDWIPGLNSSMVLPQSQNRATGVGERGGCYLYASDGSSYVLSAWNMIEGGPQKSGLYKRLGFREMSISSQFYLCNHTNIGGGATYNAANDYYKHSYTVSNISACNETPPAGA